MSKTSLDKSKIKFLLLEGVHQNAVDTLKAAGYTNIEYLKTALSGDELKERIADAHFIGIRSRTQLTEEVFDCAKKLIAVGCFCIGTNQVDLNAARERGIAVFNAPYSNTRSVAELVLAEAILLLRGIPEKNASCHRGGWIKSAANSFEIRGKKLGIVCNLAPRPMMKGKYVSEGMIFAADTADGGCSIPFYSDDTPVGARIH